MASGPEGNSHPAPQLSFLPVARKVFVFLSSKVLHGINASRPPTPVLAIRAIFSTEEKMKAKKSQIFVCGAAGPRAYESVRARVCLITLLILFSSTLLANTQNSVTPLSTTTPSTGWTWVQDSALIFCAGTNKTGCNVTAGLITPTVAGSVWVLQIQTPNNVTITSVTGGGGTWVHCPNCHVDNPAQYNTDAWYNLSGNAGTSTGISFTLSGSSGAFLGANFIEVLPPPGSTASYDDSVSGTVPACTTCTAPNMNNITGTDVIIRNDGGGQPLQWNSWSAPYMTDANGFAIGLNVTTNTGPTVTYTKSINPEYMAIAFKSSLGTFTPPSHQYSVVNFTTTGQNCSTCVLTIPSTGAGHLLFIEAGDEFNTHITSVTGGGTWVVPVGSNSCQIGHTITVSGGSISAAASCAYALSSTPGVTSITVQMSGSAFTDFAIWEISTTGGGTFSFDTQGSHVDTTNGFNIPGQALTLTGTNDVIFQLLWENGGSGGPNYYAQPTIPFNSTTNVGPFNYFVFNEAASVVLLDSGPTPLTPTWLNPQPNTVFASGVAFSASGVSNAPNPPTGLTAVVN